MFDAVFSEHLLADLLEYLDTVSAARLACVLRSAHALMSPDSMFFRTRMLPRLTMQQKLRAAFIGCTVAMRIQHAGTRRIGSFEFPVSNILWATVRNHDRLLQLEMDTDRLLSCVDVLVWSAPAVADRTATPPPVATRNDVDGMFALLRLAADVFREVFCIDGKQCLWDVAVGTRIGCVEDCEDVPRLRCLQVRWREWSARGWSRTYHNKVLRSVDCQRPAPRPLWPLREWARCDTVDASRRQRTK
ncbi:Hypothetical protein UVM_LOCUS483 [uncultured virus]|nr:Hypothetical protein UVM_LOCUS483 [uncultured virus]